MEIANFRTRGLIMVKFVKSFIMDESGASAAEYALILAIIGSLIAFTAIALGGEVQEALVRAESELNTANAAASDPAGVPAD
jgi:pilus assembly protein Flp/PilA